MGYGGVMARRVTGLVIAALAVAGAGCHTTHEIKHEVEPIHVTVDVNLKVQRELDEFFRDLDAKDQTLERAPAQAEVRQQP